MVAINDPDRERVTKKMIEYSRDMYIENINEDDSSEFQREVDRTFRSFFLCPFHSPIYRAIVNTVTCQVTQNESDYTNDLIRAFFHGLQNAAEEAGHHKNAEYVSGAIEALDEME